MDSEDRTARWFALTRQDMPAVARDRGWPIVNDHCFQRVLLDHACGGTWYDHITERPAYKHAPDAVMDRAIATGEAILAGEADLHELNRQSLRWRGKG